MKTKTKIDKQLIKKTQPELVETILAAKKNEKWLEVAGLLSGPRRKRINMNIFQIDSQSKQGDKIVIPGKVLSQGDITKKIDVIALDFSESAKEKLLNAKCSVSYISEEIKKNPDAKSVKILKK